MCYLAAITELGRYLPPTKMCLFAALTVIFATSAREVRGVTTSGALAGALVCFVLLCAAGLPAFAVLLTVFLLTWLSTRLGYARKQRMGTAEARSGRDGLQVIANLGIAAGYGLIYLAVWPDRKLIIAMGAALAEATADTVSSEIGQAVGGVPRLLTTWKSVAVGTNGAITLAGTLAGTASAIAVGVVSGLGGLFGWHWLPVCAGAGVLGTIADSLLGATLERRNLLGNNAVNFTSTAIAASVAFLLASILPL